MSIQQGKSPRASIFVRWSVLTLLVFTTGCNRDKLLKEIDEFDRAMNTGATAIAAYYTNLNEQEYDLYFQLLELYPNCEVGDRINYGCINPEWQRGGRFFDSPLKKPPFPLESIQARITLLKELTTYSKSLVALAGDDSPAQFQGNIIALGDRLTSLEKSFQALRDNNQNPDLTANQYIGPISTIIGIFGKLYLQDLQWKEIRKAIINAEDPVNTILTAVAADLDRYVDPLQDVNANARYSRLINYYNNNRLRLSPGERVEVLAKIRDFKTAYDLAVLSKPSTIPNQLKQVNLALVKTAKSNSSPQNLAQLKAELEQFKDDAEQLKNAIEQLAGIKRG